MVASVVNDLDTVDGPVVVALDDYHVIDDAEIHEAMTSLLDNLPPQVTIAMATRSDPPLPLSRLRARGELVEVRATDLRFTPELHFQPDLSYDEARHIDEVLASPEVARDLKHEEEE